ncbi:MAG: hypothetical protein PHU92_00180 [Candidatus Shapirobacteria bacterium]|nr:hypothetical protein [Candidatus Shapirobacteria bacterium]
MVPSPLGGGGKRWLPTHWGVYFLLVTLTFCGLASGALGVVTVTTPFSTSARAFSDKTGQGMEVV